jgi:hypothetical protein
MGKCKSVKPNRRVRILKDLVKNFNLEPTVIDITLKTLHNRKYGTFGEYVKEDSHDKDIPKIGKIFLLTKFDRSIKIKILVFFFVNLFTLICFPRLA